MMPILHTIRELLRFKDYTTISEIASMAGLPRKQVLETINRNGQFVYRMRKNGHITKVDPQSPLREQLWKSGRYYRQSTYGAWSVEGNCLEFEGNQELRERLIEIRRIGALGDSWNTKIIIDTPDNRAALEDAGLRPWEDAIIDDSLWSE